MIRPKGARDKRARRRKSDWTVEQIQFLKDNYQTMPKKDLMDKLGKSRSNLMNKVRALGLIKKNFLKTTKNTQDLKEYSGVYGLYNKVEDMIYIGSADDIQIALDKDIALLCQNKHHNLLLQEDWNFSNFVFVLLDISIDNQDRILKGWNNAYNHHQKVENNRNSSIKENVLDSNILMFEDRREEFLQFYFNEVEVAGSKNDVSIMDIAKKLGLEKHYQAVYAIFKSDGRYGRGLF